MGARSRRTVPARQRVTGRQMQRTAASWTLLVCVAVSLTGGKASGHVRAVKPVQPKTVVDYFLLLPQRYFEGSPSDLLSASGKTRRPIVDVGHDYILAPGGDAQPTLNVVLFRHNERVLVAVLDGGYDPPIPTLDFLRYEHRHWKKVTKQVLPQDAWPDPYQHWTYTLPRHGTTIEVTDSGGAQVFDLVWRDGRFHIRR